MNTELLKTTNMERKLELKDICGYLPHRLTVTDDGYHTYDLSNISLFQGIFKADICQQVNDEFFDEGELFISDLTPILRPLSDLYRTITHNGKEITPIVELAKIAEPNYVWNIHGKMAIRETIYETWTDKVFFGYTGLHRYFYNTEKSNRYFYSVYQNYNLEYIPDQIPLFEYLHELKIDYRGLIDSGLAIDANTLETNPYK